MDLMFSPTIPQHNVISISMKDYFIKMLLDGMLLIFQFPDLELLEGSE